MFAVRPCSPRVAPDLEATLTCSWTSHVASLISHVFTDLPTWCPDLLASSHVFVAKSHVCTDPHVVFLTSWHHHHVFEDSPRGLSDLVAAPSTSWSPHPPTWPTQPWIFVLSPRGRRTSSPPGDPPPPRSPPLSRDRTWSLPASRDLTSPRDLTDVGHQAPTTRPPTAIVFAAWLGATPGTFPPHRDLT